MTETEIKTEDKKKKISKLAIASIIFGGIPPFAPIGLVLGILAITRIKKSKGQLTGQTAAILGIVAATSFIIIMILVILIISISGFGFPKPRPFSECNPNKVIALIENSFDFNLPDNISSAKAAETRTTWLDDTYRFILNFSTDEKGWEQFHTSFPKIKDQDTIYGYPNGTRHVHDVYDFTDYDPNKYEPRIEPYWGWPEWFKAKIRKGKNFSGHMNSKDGSLQINTLCIDLAESENVIIYIGGWGRYNPKYGID
ncbi:MAG: DUF4190 domain-containing protein [Planctomycetes bacterium]|nr:DUF4190 domain-containing protein [Planctomycetota bacterium]